MLRLHPTLVPAIHSSFPPPVGVSPFLGLLGAAMVSISAGLAAEEPSFLRAINLNGPPLEINGRHWDGKGASDLDLAGMDGFENQNVPLRPPADAALATMLRSSHWRGDGRNRIVIGGLPAEPLTVFLYAWEDNDPETYDVLLNGSVVLNSFHSGTAGEWKRLGPWTATPKDGRIELASRGGHANWSGIELWRGELANHPGQHPPPLPKPVTAAARHFDRTIAPLLSRHCLECHNPSDAKGKLDLTRAEGATKAIVPGDPDHSELWAQIEDDEMPKKRKALDSGEKKILRDWIASGAEWGTRPVDPFLATTERRAGYDWWSLQPVRKPPVPAVADESWPRNEVDRFLLARLEAEGFPPAPEADRRTLIRRLSFDLCGLPPTPEEVEAFLQDRDPRAYEALVDRLLASPAFGERWARHWLDVVRFGESQGFERNRIRDNAWRYRDWVIGALNRDLPYDEFIRQQIAGDVLYPDQLEPLLATGFHVCGTWDQVGHNEGSQAMRLVARQEHLEDLVATCGQAILALTVNCARCHDHKFDPISQREYYQIAALLGGVNQEEKEREGIALQGPGFNGAAHVIVPRQPATFYVLERGDVNRPGEVVTPAGLRALAGIEADLGLTPDAPESERRKRFAMWLSDPRNPLPARVHVNRLWQGVFGDGLVDTPSDFGFNGGTPSHPELLDWLAAHFIEGGWKTRDLIRLLVTSAAYRQDSRVPNESAESKDAGNRLHWRAPLRRLEGEEVRDAMLAVSGALNRTMGGPSFRDVAVKLGNNHEFTDPTNEFNEDTCRRAIYRLWARSGGHPMLDSFDCPDPSVMAPRRNRTITPLQAFSLLNNPFAKECAHRLAQRAGAATDKPAEQIRAVYRFALQRAPTDQEAALAASFLADESLPQLCLVLFNTNEFLHLR